MQETCAAVALQTSQAPVLCCSRGRPLERAASNRVVLFIVAGVMNDLWPSRGELHTSLVDTEQTCVSMGSQAPSQTCRFEQLAHSLQLSLVE